MKFNTVPCRIVILQESDNGYRIGSPPPPPESNQNCTHRTGYPIPMPPHAGGRSTRYDLKTRRVAARAAVKAPGAIENEGIYAAPQPDDVLAGQRIHIEIYRSGTRSQCSKARAAHRLGCEQPPKFWGLYIGRAPASLQGAIATLAPLRV
eukprot:COSAG02_NODE_36_length_48934_cov_144.851029_1_plen_150_part_00